jgi:serine/threonine-protein kinase
MSPEQARGEPLDERADIYSLGVCLYEALAGVPPYRSYTTVELLTEVAFGRVLPLPADLALHPTIADTLNRALAPSPGERYPSAAAMRGAFLAWHALEGRTADGDDASTVRATLVPRTRSA